MVNRPFPWQWVKWVGLYNNQEYKNVRNAAKAYATVLNKYATQPRTAANNKVVTNAKNVLTREVNKYLAGGTNVIGPAYKTLPPGERMGPAQPTSAPPPAPVPGPNGSILGNLYNRKNSKNAYLKQVPIFQGNGMYFYKPNPNGRNYATVVRRGNTTNFIVEGHLYTKNNATGRFNKQVNQATANAAAAKKAAFQKFYANFEPVGNMNWNTIIRGIAGRGNTNNSRSLRSFTKNNNNNRNNHANFWAAVNKLKAENAAAGPPRNTTANVAKFLTWYTAPERAELIKNPNMAAETYVRRLKNNTTKNSVGGGFVTGKINTNASRAPFWAAVKREMNRRAAGGK